MGIPSFYRHLVKTNPSLIRQTCVNLPSVLALDLNCAIYHCLAKLQKKTPFVKEKQEEFENTLIKMVIQYIVKLRDHVQPTKLLYVAVDGVVPMAKIRQQRMRRFKSVWVSAEEAKIKGSSDLGWDRNAITPGTAFMDLLTTRLEEWGSNQLGIKTVISGVNQSGEGEQKIMSYLRSLDDVGGSIVVYGLDADLIILCLWHHEEYKWSFKLLREEVEMKGGVKLNDRGEENLLYFDIDSLAIILKGKWSVSLRDYVGAMSFLGNDFVPHGLTLCIREDGIDKLMEILEQIGMPLIILKEGSWDYDQDVLRKVISAISLKEEKWVLDSLSKKLKMSSHGRRTEEESDVEKALNTLNMLPLSWKVERVMCGRGQDHWYLHDGWSDKYYEQFLWGCKREKAVEEWLKSLSWILNYYTGCKPVDMLWYYPWYLPPLFSDISKYNMEIEHKLVDGVNPISPLDQLIMVLPVESYWLLPSKKRGLPFNNPEYFPKAWSFFSAGRRMLWECEPMIPMLPFNIVNGFLRKFDSVPGF
jgi:5'-3' exonuclease